VYNSVPQGFHYASLHLIFEGLIGGGEGICTPVSKSCHKSVYACVL